MNQKLRHQLNIHKISGSYIMEQQNFASFFPFFFIKKKTKTCFITKRIVLYKHVR
jgi:hypothetical protein